MELDTSLDLNLDDISLGSELDLSSPLDDDLEGDLSFNFNGSPKSDLSLSDIFRQSNDSVKPVDFLSQDHSTELGAISSQSVGNKRKDRSPRYGDIVTRGPHPRSFLSYSTLTQCPAEGTNPFNPSLGPGKGCKFKPIQSYFHLSCKSRRASIQKHGLVPNSEQLTDVGGPLTGKLFFMNNWFADPEFRQNSNMSVVKNQYELIACMVKYECLTKQQGEMDLWLVYDTEGVVKPHSASGLQKAGEFESYNRIPPENCFLVADKTLWPPEFKRSDDYCDDLWVRKDAAGKRKTAKRKEKKRRSKKKSRMGRQSRKKRVRKSKRKRKIKVRRNGVSTVRRSGKSRTK